MFVNAIETVAGFTRPLHTIFRLYGTNNIIPGSATLFFVNEEGYAVTCKHIIDLLAASAEHNKKYAAFREEKSQAGPNPGPASLNALEAKYQYGEGAIAQVKNTFVDCIDKMSGFTWHLHPTYDLAILKFNDFGKTLYTGHARFLRNTTQVKQGSFLCRLGFPFPEFNNFKYDEAMDDIEWTTAGVAGSPRFPIEGMVTRFLADGAGQYGIELSTPGLRGQSGGPLFDKKGIVCGMQSSTKHLHLGFDILEKEILVNNKSKTVSDYSFIHLGQCIHADIIKDFLREKGVRFYEAN